MRSPHARSFDRAFSETRAVFRAKQPGEFVSGSERPDQHRTDLIEALDPVGNDDRPGSDGIEDAVGDEPFVRHIAPMIVEHDVGRGVCLREHSVRHMRRRDPLSGYVLLPSMAVDLDLCTGIDGPQHRRTLDSPGGADEEHPRSLSSGRIGAETRGIRRLEERGDLHSRLTSSPFGPTDAGGIDDVMRSKLFVGDELRMADDPEHVDRSVDAVEPGKAPKRDDDVDVGDCLIETNHARGIHEPRQCRREVLRERHITISVTLCAERR
nr:hypothetical protein [Agromyces ramosus]